MTHERKKIRAAAEASILNGATAAEDRVWASREPPVNVEGVLIDQGPVILIYTRHDRSHADSFSGSGTGPQRRLLDLHVEITAAGAYILDDTLDDMAEQVEGLMDALAIPGMPATEIRHYETIIETSQEFEQPIGGALLTYHVAYWRAWRDPEEDIFFPHLVKTSAQGEAPEVVADCDDCDDCPLGGQI